jgi:Fe2+ or Zn2+ uptake regulation protein
VIKEANLSNLNITKKIKEKNSFSVTKWSVEVHGICINCK